LELSFRFRAFVAGGLLVGDPQNQLAIQCATRHINRVRLVHPPPCLTEIKQQHTRHINFPRRTRRRCFRTEPDTTEPHGLMMFATKPRPSRRRYCRATLSWSTRTPSNFASIAPSSGRQHDPQHEAGMWQSRVLAQLAVLDATNSQSCISYEDNVSLLSSVLVSTRKAAHAQSSPAVPCRFKFIARSPRRISA